MKSPEKATLRLEDSEGTCHADIQGEENAESHSDPGEG